MQGDSRPVFLNLFQIRLPIPGVVSIAHRISGLLLFLAIPLVLYLLMRSLRGPEDFRRVLELLHNPLFAVVLLGLLWSFWHHLFSGIRFLLIDVEMGLAKSASRKSAALVLAAGAMAAVLSLVGILI